MARRSAGLPTCGHWLEGGTPPEQRELRRSGGGCCLVGGHDSGIATPRRKLRCSTRTTAAKQETETEVAVESARREMARARAADIRRPREAVRFPGHSAAGSRAAPDAAAGAAVDGDSEDEVAVGVSGCRAGGSADAPRPRQDPADRAAAPQWQGKRGRNRWRAKGPESGGHGCPQSADPEVTARNRRKKARKAAAQERFFARLETMSEDAKTKDAWDRSYDRYYRQHMLELRQARRSRTASEASGSTSFRARSSRAAAGAAAEERRGQN